MLFWRAKSAKQAVETKAAQSPEDESPAQETAAQPDETAATAAAAVSGNSPPTAVTAAGSKIISIASSRLSERLAEVSGKLARADVAEPVHKSGDRSKPVEGLAASHDIRVQAKTLASLRESLGGKAGGGHILVVGPAASGRQSAVVNAAADAAKDRPAPCDWIYAATGRHSDMLQVYAVPAGTGERLVRDVQDALAKSSAMLARFMVSDGHQMALAVLEEEHRQRGDGPLEQLKQRAEAQNVALVKTTDGFVLAPMHEGRVVRADVFRALPEALQRDVEAKVTTLESELQALLGALAGNDVATDDRHLALSQQTAERAVKPNLAVARKLFSAEPAVCDIFDDIEAGWTRRATAIVRSGEKSASLTVPGLQAIGAGHYECAPVVVAHTVSPQDLLGEIGRDAAGAIAIRAGHLARANGGFMIVDAWRLVTDPLAWVALSAALETGELRPMPSPGLAVTAAAVPLQIKLIVIAEPDTLAKLKTIDPRFAQHFSSIVTFDAPAMNLHAAEAAT